MSACPRHSNPTVVVDVKQGSYLVARLLWFFPAFLFFLAGHQVKVALDLRHTLAEGTPAVAEVQDYFTSDRAEAPYGHITLSVPLASGDTLVRDRMPLPYTLLPVVKDKATLDVLVLPGADQPVVIREIVRTQWKMAAIQAPMALVAAILAAAGVFFWNRFLRRQGDPAVRSLVA